MVSGTSSLYSDTYSNKKRKQFTDYGFSFTFLQRCLGKLLRALGHCGPFVSHPALSCLMKPASPFSILVAFPRYIIEFVNSVAESSASAFTVPPFPFPGLHCCTLIAHSTVWSSGQHMRTAELKIDNQQGPTAQRRKPCSRLCNSRGGNGIGPV